MIAGLGSWEADSRGILLVLLASVVYEAASLSEGQDLRVP